MPENDQVITKDTITKATNEIKENHDVSVSTIESLPELLADPIVIYKDMKGDSSNRLALVDAKTKSGKPVVAAVGRDKKHGRTLVNQILSAYGKDYFYGKELLFFRNEKPCFGTTSPASIAGEWYVITGFI
jgi:hypothetical protein